MEETPLWDFAQYRPDIVVIKLGTNDFSTGTPSREQFDASFGEMHALLRRRYGDVPILYVVPQNCDAYYDYLRATIRTLGDPNLHAVPHLAPINDQTDDLGAGYHPCLLYTSHFRSGRGPVARHARLALPTGHHHRLPGGLPRELSLIHI